MPHGSQRTELIDFKGLELDGGIYPTDIDGIIEYRDSEYIILEVKHSKAKVPWGQRLCLQRMVDEPWCLCRVLLYRKSELLSLLTSLLFLGVPAKTENRLPDSHGLVRCPKRRWTMYEPTTT